MEQRIGGKFRIVKIIGKGAFGDVFLGLNTENNENVAIKLENPSVKHSQLQYESRIYRIIEGTPGIPKMQWFGSENNLNMMVIDLLGPSLEELRRLSNTKMSLKSVLMIADQLITRLESLHSLNFLHRDIKPENFLVGLGNKAKTVYMIDFGLSKKYQDSRTNQHIPLRKERKLTGTARYVSIYTHLGYDQSRRDDLESLAYVLIYLLKGSLPWQDINDENKEEKHQKILSKKESTSVSDLCKNIPVEFESFLNYSKSLEFEEKPDYDFLRNLFNELFLRELYIFDSVYDWTRLAIRKDSLNFEQYNFPVAQALLENSEEKKQD